MNYLNISFDFATETGKFDNNVIPKGWSGVHPHEYVNLRIQGKFNGACSTIHPLTLRSFKTKGFFSVAVIDIADLENREQKSKLKYTPISKFPASKFDCTVLVPKDTAAATVIESLKKVKIKELTEKKIVDVFNLNEESNAVTLSVTFEDPSKTLDNDLIKQAEEKIISTLASAGFPLKA